MAEADPNIYGTEVRPNPIAPPAHWCASCEDWVPTYSLSPEQVSGALWMNTATQPSVVHTKAHVFVIYTELCEYCDAPLGAAGRVM